jgi:FkbM family methyltransferase
MLRRLFDRLRGRRPSTNRRADLPGEHIGSDYGGYRCRVDRLDAGSLVYSFGVGRDISFDRGLIERFGLTVHAFDPTPASLEWLRGQVLPTSFHVHPFGVAGFDGTARFRLPRKRHHVSHAICAEDAADEDCVSFPVFRLPTILGRLGHRRIDLLKMDVEGAEYAVLQDLLVERIDAPQVLVEFHHGQPGFDRADTDRAIAGMTGAGYAVFHVSDSGREYSFLRD